MTLPSTLRAARPMVWMSDVSERKKPSLSASRMATKPHSGMSSPSRNKLMAISQQYTRDACVRSFERELMKLARKAVTEIIKGKTKSVAITAANISDYLGVPRYRHGEAEGEDQVGVVTGLAWTEVGGELLTIEGVMMPGKG